MRHTAIDYDILFLVMTILFETPPLNTDLYRGWVHIILGKMSRTELIRICAHALGGFDSDFYISQLCVQSIYNVVVTEIISFETFLSEIRQCRLQNARLLGQKRNLCTMIMRRQSHGRW